MINLMHGDCLELMRDIPDASVDFVLTDPPYGISYKTNHRKDKTHDFCSVIDNDSNLDWLPEFVKGCFRILKSDSALYCFCGYSKIDIFKQEIEKFFTIKNLLVWDKGNCGAGDLEGSFGNSYELCFVAAKGRHILNGNRDRDILRYARVAGPSQIHQNQKPVDMLTYLISKSSHSGFIILDPFMGSGSTGVACVNTGRNFIGIEMDDEYFQIAKNRIETAEKNKQAQPELIPHDDIFLESPPTLF